LNPENSPQGPALRRLKILGLTLTPFKP